MSYSYVSIQTYFPELAGLQLHYISLSWILEFLITGARMRRGLSPTRAKAMWLRRALQRAEARAAR